jgi:hypothetical protein
MGIYASIANNDPALAALLRETAAATVNRRPEIDYSLVHDGLQFATHGDRCRYIGMSRTQQSRWREQNKGRFQPIKDIRQEPQLGPQHSGVAPTGPSTAAPTREAEGPQTQATPFGDPGRKRGRRDRSQVDKQKLPARNSKVGRKLSPERMRIVLESLMEYPVLWHAANKAGIHRKTLEYWLKRSAAGDAGYDIEWDGVIWRFHEHCKSAIGEADDKLLEAAWDIAMGGAVYKTDPLLVDLGCEGPDAYATDENGNFIVEAVRRPNFKMIRFLLEWVRPEKCGKHRKNDIPQTGGVLVIGERTEKPDNSCAASIKARQWKSRSRTIEKAKS